MQTELSEAILEAGKHRLKTQLIETMLEVETELFRAKKVVDIFAKKENLDLLDHVVVGVFMMSYTNIHEALDPLFNEVLTKENIGKEIDAGNKKVISLLEIIENAEKQAANVS